MKLKEMLEVCSKMEHKCDWKGKRCPLYINGKWPYEESCLLELRKQYNNKYRMHMERNELDKAEETIKEYASLESKYLGK